MPPTLTDKELAGRVGSDGRVKMYDIPEQKWKRVPQVDAREMVKVGTGDMFGPRVTLVNSGGTQIECCQVEVKSYQAQGYTAVKGQAVPDENADESTSGGGETKTDAEPYDFTLHKVTELRTFAEAAGLGNFSEMTKGQLVAALEASGWRPDGSDNIGSETETENG